MRLFFTFFIFIFISSNAFAFENEAEKFKALQYMTHENTLIVETDYASENLMKTFEEYDFTVESSPCNVLGDYYSIEDDSNTIYTIKIDKTSFQFMCRQVNGMKEDHRRLYLIGSTHDCISRPFDYATSEIEDYQYLGSLCKKEKRAKQNIDFVYLELFHPAKYYQVLANLVK